MPKRTKVEAVRAWGVQNPYLLLPRLMPDIIRRIGEKPVRIVILREADYRRLVKAANGGKRK